MIDRREIGRIGEDCACVFLMKKGYEILERNYRKPYGEVDIIARKGNTVRFVEVKAISCENIQDVTRENNTYRPEEQVHPMKLKKIARVAEIYMGDREGDLDFQIDVVGVFVDESRKVAKCRLFEGVF